jgi:glycosyltransferase involved in cell wall biosynthesis
MTLDLANALQGRGHDVKLVCLRSSGEWGKLAAEMGIEVAALEKAEGFSLAALRRMLALFRRWRPDVVHTHNPLVHHYGGLAGRLAGAPVVVSTLHGINNISLKPGSREFIYRLMVPFTDQMVAVCASAYEYFSHNAMIPSYKLARIDNGIPLERFLKIPVARPNGEFVFGTVGRLVAMKDQNSLIEAFSRIAEEYPRCRLEILGDGPLRPVLEQKIAALNLQDRVCLRGYSADVAGFLSTLHTFVLSSVTEGLPLTVLEAMASGLPIVGTDVGGMSELVQKAGCGWLCPPSAPEHLAKALRAALESSDRERSGIRGRKFVQERYSVSRMTEQYERLFESVLDKRKSRTTWN